MDGFWKASDDAPADGPASDAAARRARAAAVLQNLEDHRRDAGEDRPIRHDTVPTGLEGVDAVLPGGGLRRGAVHEWIGVGSGQNGAQGVAAAQGRRGHGRGEWSPPLAVLLGLAGSASRGQRVVWVGEAVWPYAVALRRALHESGGKAGCGNAGAEVDACLFVRARTSADRLWAVDTALRCRGVGAVIADGSGLDLGSTRRLQLAAEASGGVCLLARPPWERGELSACTTRWSVAWQPSPIPTRRWTVELLRCKGVQPGVHTQRVWTVEQSDATGGLHLAPDVRDRSGAASDAARSRVAIA